MKRRELLKYLGMAPLLPYMAGMPKAHAGFNEYIQIGRIWELSYRCDRTTDEFYALDDRSMALKQLASDELARLIPEKFRHRVKFIDQHGRRQEDPLGQLGYYGWRYQPEMVTGRDVIVYVICKERINPYRDQTDLKYDLKYAMKWDL